MSFSAEFEGMSIQYEDWSSGSAVLKYWTYGLEDISLQYNYSIGNLSALYNQYIPVIHLVQNDTNLHKLPSLEQMSTPDFYR